MIRQISFKLQGRRRGAHLVTAEIEAALGGLPEVGLVNLLIQHTSAALTINENADPDVRADMAAIFDHLVPERQSYYTHTFEGDDDMPAHAKSTLAGVSLSIPVTGHRLNLGRWQGIYLLEFRDFGGPRSIVATIIS